MADDQTYSRLPREVSCLILALAYNPPKSAKENYLLDHLAFNVTQLREKYPSSGIIIILCGDFTKADIFRIGDKQLCNVVKKPTSGVICLDLIITNISKFYQDASYREI